MNPTTMVNLNRMTLLMSVSEITPQLFISGQMAATLEQVQKLGITYILNVAVESSPVVYPKNIKLEKYDIIDFPTAPICNYFNALTDKIHAHLTGNNQNKVLVHCMAGISRSTTIVCAYLMRYMDMSLRDAYLLCKKNRPICFPNLGFWNQLIAYENQLKKDNSVKMIPTQFGNVPDVAFEELKQLRAQQQQQTGSILLPPASFTVTNNNPVNSSNISSDTLTNPIRPSARDLTIAHANSLVRSRSLASNSTARPSVAASSTNPTNPAHPTSLFPSSKQSFLTPTRFGVGRLLTGGIPNNNSHPSAPSSSSTSYTSNRNLPISTSPNIKNRNTNNLNNHSHHSPTVTINSPATTATTAANNDQQRHTYETTYRASFIKPLAP
jgi:protein-tyrosine phosphatase